MERYKVTLAYDGTHFFGFQRQGQTRTVQWELEAALQRIGWQGGSVLAAGRTDSGVHAAGQVVAFDLQWPHGLTALRNALNANLPEDVAVQMVELARSDFHPRYDALARTYTYQVSFALQRNPLSDRFAWRVWPTCSLEMLREAAHRLHGVHDFAAFGNPPRPAGSTIRTVFAADWHLGDDGIARFSVTANAFLYHMVRRMVFVQMMVGKGRLSLDVFDNAAPNNPDQAVFAAETQRMPGLAPPQGLILQKVRYAGETQGDVEISNTL